MKTMYEICAEREKEIRKENVIVWIETITVCTIVIGFFAFLYCHFVIEPALDKLITVSTMIQI